MDKKFQDKKLQTFMMAVIILLCALLTGASASILSLPDIPFRKLEEECDSPQAVVYPYMVFDITGTVVCCDEIFGKKTRGKDQCAGNDSDG